jgi:hypothetical protein
MEITRIVMLCGLLAIVVRAGATERHVPAKYSTIQAAITAAQPGDEVVIADGVYTGTSNKSLDFAGRAITVRSASGDPAACIIDCQGSWRGFYFHTGETSASVVQGLTIREMLRAEVLGEKYVKADHRRRVLPLLDGAGP